MSDAERLAARAVRLLDCVDTAEALGWDNRKTMLEVFQQGRNADYLVGEDDFHKDYGGFIAVARWAAQETLDISRADLGNPIEWTQ